MLRTLFTTMTLPWTNTTNPHNEKTLNQLPNEVLVEIITSVPSSIDQVCLALINHRLYSLVLSTTTTGAHAHQLDNLVSRKVIPLPLHEAPTSVRRKFTTAPITTSSCTV